MIKLRYAGNGEYIMGIPARDLTAHDLEMVAFERGWTGQEATDYLTARGLYEADEKYICEECGKEYVSYTAFHKHELTHIQDELPASTDEGEWAANGQETN